MLLDVTFGFSVKLGYMVGWSVPIGAMIMKNVHSKKIFRWINSTMY